MDTPPGSTSSQISKGKPNYVTSFDSLTKSRLQPRLCRPQDTRPVLKPPMKIVTNSPCSLMLLIGRDNRTQFATQHILGRRHAKECASIPHLEASSSCCSTPCIASATWSWASAGSTTAAPTASRSFLEAASNLFAVAAEFAAAGGVRSSISKPQHRDLLGRKQSLGNLRR
jgi:hypothetical protein